VAPTEAAAEAKERVSASGMGARRNFRVRAGCEARGEERADGRKEER